MRQVVETVAVARATQDPEDIRRLPLRATRGTRGDALENTARKGGVEGGCRPSLMARSWTRKGGPGGFGRQAEVGARAQGNGQLQRARSRRPYDGSAHGHSHPTVLGHAREDGDRRPEDAHHRHGPPPRQIRKRCWRRGAADSRSGLRFRRKWVQLHQGGLARSAQEVCRFCVATCVRGCLPTPIPQCQEEGPESRGCSGGPRKGHVSNVGQHCRPHVRHRYVRPARRDLSRNVVL
mmetsp:Transcript_18763/g.37926  ORF Transcript_18763/g.37926 Transcript_18763/m.37926 type:complete len:236 (+) Transcript_18763:2229-2936(+)